MKLNDVTARIPAWYAASIEEGGPSFHLTSDPGRGKTSVLMTAPGLLKAAFADGEYGVTLINGANATLSTLCGYMWPADHGGVKYSDFTKPFWWMTKEGKPLTEYEGGIVIVDEEDKLGLDEKKIVGEGALSKVLANHRLPPNWVVWFAGNYAKNRSGSTKRFDHLINRRNEIAITDDIVSLADWMRTHGCLPETITFAEENPQIVFMDAPEQQGPWCTPRSLYAQDVYLRAIAATTGSDAIPTDALTTEEIAGGIGIGAAAQLINTIKLGQELPDYNYIVANSRTVAVPKKPDSMRLAAYKTANRVSERDAAQVLEYIGRFPDEFQVLFVKMAVDRQGSLVLNKDFAKWCASKASLLALVHKLKK